MAKIRQQMVRDQSSSGITCHTPPLRLGSAEGRTGLEQVASFGGSLCTEKSDPVIRRSGSSAYGLAFRLKIWLESKDL